jgi:hypothetical protein
LTPRYLVKLYVTEASKPSKRRRSQKNFCEFAPKAAPAAAPQGSLNVVVAPEGSVKERVAAGDLNQPRE